MMKRTAILLSFLLCHLWPSQAQLQMFFSADSLSSITSPLDVDSLFYWFAADVGVTDSLGGAIATDEGVGSWLDLSGRGHHVTQSTNGARPVWKATGGPGGYPCIQFDGTDDFLASAAHFWGSDDLTVFVVMKFGNATRNAIEAYISRLSGSTVQYELRGRESSQSYNEQGFISKDGTGAVGNLYTIGPKQSTWILTSIAGSGASSWLWYRDQVSQSVTRGGTGDDTIFNTSIPLNIGARDGTSLFFQGSVSEVIIYARGLSSTERTAIELYLNRKYDLY